ncbi:superfamily II DNA helicase [Halobacillus sp. A1]|uniref:RQC-minor-1 family DNA-binding protein n=1 Tax=Halobacillus sp. A1 TaxID=2880262 RepID=UPI0020A6920D|nr:RQC-minor-1 family DNA-binding protein [Halobacillus sp. A1]MCP3030003.1 superfamily II DNA helicase [Halobacillus sp. A1]
MAPNPLTHKEIKTILATADWIIARGGRTQLAKILKGSKEKKLLERDLDKSPGYGFYNSEKLDDITSKINWMIQRDFLKLEKFGRLPLIVFTDRGWLIQSSQYADKLVREWEEWIGEGKKDPDMTYLKDRDRQMILLMLEKIKASGNKAFIPYLQLWEEIDYRKVRAAIRETVKVLEGKVPFDDSMLKNREERTQKALEGFSEYEIFR